MAKSDALYDNPKSPKADDDDPGAKVAGKYLDPKQDEDAQSMLDVEDAKRNSEPVPAALDKKVRDMIKKKLGTKT